MYYINKIVGWVLSPLGILFLGLGFAWLLGVMGKRRNDKVGGFLIKSSRWVTVCILVVTWIMGCGITTRFVGVPLEKDWKVVGKPHGDISGLPNADAVMVLGGGMGVHAQCGAPEMFGAADRVWHAGRLYKAGKSRLICVSGKDAEKSTILFLNDLGVPKGAIMTVIDPRNTEEEARTFLDLLREETDNEYPRILLVTSAWHMSRAKLLFERVGFDVVSAPTDFEMSCVQETSIRFEDFLPSSDALARNSYCLKEWVGNIGYRLFRR